MINILINQQIILQIFIKKGQLSSSEVHEELIHLGNDVSLVTVKRELSNLVEDKLIISSGAGRSVKYTISSRGRLFAGIDAKAYASVEPDKRIGQSVFNHDLFGNIGDEIFSEKEISLLEKATDVYISNTKSISETIEQKELERFVIELSWKSSKIEGNTYTLLDTEKLILEGVEAKGHDTKEAKMILNHKEAFGLIVNNPGYFKELNLSKIEEIHKILVKDLDVSIGLRSKGVGVTGSIYRPLDNIHQIRENIETLCKVVNGMASPYAKALVALLGISYIQPFEDGNKRTSRLIANAILLSHGKSPLSYRSVDEDEYREAVLVFYEINSLVPFKKIFIEQYIFASKNYAVK